MTYSAKHVEGFLASAEQAEILEGEDQFAYELAIVLSPEQLKTGAEINFGTNEAAFEKALKLLKIKQHISQDLHVLQGTAEARSRGGPPLDVLKESIKELGLVRTLGVLQSHQWQVDVISDLHSEVKLPEVIWSTLLLGQETLPDANGTVYIDTDNIAIRLTQKTRYQPAFYDDNDNEDDYLHIFDEAKRRGSIVGTMASLVINTGGSIVVPYTSYSLEVSEKFEKPSRELESWGGKFVFENGHIVRQKTEEDDEDEDVGDIDWEAVFSRRRNNDDEFGEDDDNDDLDERQW